MVFPFCSSVELRTLVAKTAAAGKSPSRGLRQRSIDHASQPPTSQKRTQPRKRKREVSMVESAPDTALIQVSGVGNPKGLPGWAARSAEALKYQGTRAAPAAPRGRARKAGRKRARARTAIASTA